MSLPPETAVHHLRNVLQAFVQSARNIDDLTVFTPAEAAAIVVRVKAALRELEGPRSTLHHGDNRECPNVIIGQWQYCHGHEVGREYAVDLAPGARMDGAPLGSQEPE